MDKHNLGDIVADEVTGFEGVVTAICKYAYETDQVLVEARELDRDGQPVAKWFPHARVRQKQG